MVDKIRVAGIKVIAAVGRRPPFVSREHVARPGEGSIGPHLRLIPRFPGSGRYMETVPGQGGGRCLRCLGEGIGQPEKNLPGSRYRIPVAGEDGSVFIPSDGTLTGYQARKKKGGQQEKPYCSILFFHVERT